MLLRMGKKHITVLRFLDIEIMTEGVNYYNGNKETYYNLDMSGCVSIMRNMGNTDEYWVREDGCKMLGNPIYHILLQNNSNNICTNQISLDIFVILNKYNDYADRSTLHAFDLYHKNRDKDSFINFKNNINNKYIYLRKRLGYLEPNLIQAYTYSSKNEKSVLRLVLECTVAYITMLAYALLSASVHTVITWIAFSLICIIIIELLTLFFRNILIYIRKIIKHIKSNNKCRKN